MRKKEKIKPLFLILAIAVLILGSVLTILSRHSEDNPYRAEQVEAAERMFAAESYMKEEILSRGIEIEADDLNGTGLLGPEFTELTSTPGDPAAKRTSLSPDFAALMVRYYKQAGLKEGDRVAIGSSGSFPGLLIASIIAADVLGLDARVICSLGSSMHGATRVDYNVFDILHALSDGGFATFTVLAVSPGGGNDQGGGLLEDILYTGTRELSMELCIASGYPVINIPNLAENIQYRFSLYGDDIKLFVNIGGASPNCGTSSYTLNFPQGLVMDPPTIPTDAERGLNYEYAAIGVPVVNLLNVRKLAQDNGIVFDSVPFTLPGESGVYSTTEYNRVIPIITIILTFAILVGGIIKSRNEEKNSD